MQLSGVFPEPGVCFALDLVTLNSTKTSITCVTEILPSSQNQFVAREV